MTPRLRLIVNIFAWLAFLLIAPFLISYSMGHRFTPSSPNPVPVGTFLIRTIPNNAEVSLDGKKIGNKTPTSIQNLLPGSYNINLNKTGYFSWNKNLPISGTFVTDVREVRLIPSVIEEDVMRENISDFVISPKRQWLGLIENKKNEKQLRVVAFNKYADAGNLIKINISNNDTIKYFWSHSEDYLLLNLTRGKSVRNYLIETKTGNATLMSNDGANIVGWISTLTEEKVVKLKSGKVIIAPLTGNGTETIVQNSELISFSSNGFAALEHSNNAYMVHTFSQSGNEQDQIVLPELNGNFVTDLFLSPTGDIAALVQPTQKLILWDNADQTWHNITEHAENITWSPEGDKIAWQESPFDLWVMNIHEKRTLLSPYHAELVARLSTPIRKPTWYAGSHQLLFFERDTLKIAELDPRDGHIINSLISTNIGNSRAEVIQNGDEIIATVSHNNVPSLSRFFMLEKADR